MRGLVIASLAVLVGCLQPSAVECTDGRVCPSGSTCDVTRGLCVTEGQSSVCDGMPDGEACAFAGMSGVCDMGVCIATACGNGVIDLTEVCDDGNRESGDGCRGDCSKVEACGDQVVDTGEACDDGNANAADGCDACGATAWTATVVIGGNANATSAGLFLPNGIATDRRGNIYVVDSLSYRVRRVDTNGVMLTIAGTGASGISADGGLATSTELGSPAAVAVDGLGNVFIAERSGHRIRRVDQRGVITTVAGSTVAGSSGDGGFATNARLDQPIGIAVDGLGNLFIADSNNHRVRRVDPNGIITTIAGTGAKAAGADGTATTSALDTPSAVALDSAGNVYVADTNNHRVRRITSGTITTIAGTGIGGFSGDGGAATAAQLQLPGGLATDAGGNVYIADTSNNRVRRVTTTGTITTVAGSGFPFWTGDGIAATTANMAAPRGVAIDHLGRLHVTDTGNHRVRQIDGNGIIMTIAGNGSQGFTGDGGAATSAPIGDAFGVAVDAAGNVYVASPTKHRIRRIDPAGVVTTVAGTGLAGFAGDGGAAASAQVNFPTAVAYHGGDLYIADATNHRVRRVDATGAISTVAGTGDIGSTGDGGPATAARLYDPAGLAVDSAGTLFIVERAGNRIRKVTAGVISTVAGTGTAGAGGDGAAAIDAQLSAPTSVAIDTAGVVYIADANNHRVRRVGIDGVITTVAGTGTAGSSGDGGAATSAQLSTPSGVAVDSSGRIYVADRANHRVRRIGTDGVITTVVGTGAIGQSGDGGPATDAKLQFPTGLAFDAAGRLHVTEQTADSVRRVDTSNMIVTIGGPIDPEGMGPVAQARLADPRALFVTPRFTLVAGGNSGTLQALRPMAMTLEVVAGRYGQTSAVANLARYAGFFGTIHGVAHDAAQSLIYITESSSNRLHAITPINIDDARTWTIAPLAGSALGATPGFVDGAAASARFRGPTGLYFDEDARRLYVADTGNHVIRTIDLSSGVSGATVQTFAGIGATRGFAGDGGAATSALLYEPAAITRCPNGDLFIADTGNHRVRRVEAGTSRISTVLGEGTASTSGEGRPATAFPVDAPRGLACDSFGNLYVTSTTGVRQLPADDNHVVDGTGAVYTVYGAPPRDVFPASVTRCLTGLLAIDETTLRFTDSCTGLLVELRRAAL